MVSTPTVDNLYGRDELLSDVLETVRGRRCPLTLLNGDAGVGRTAVLTELGARLNAEGVRVLELRVGEQDGAMPYGALYRLLSDAEELAPVERHRSVSPLALAAKLSSASDPAAPLIADRLAAAVCSAARRLLPLVVLVDDAHRLDEATVALLRPLVYRMVGSSFSMVLSTRSDAALPAGIALDGLWEAGFARSVQVRPLTRSESRQLIARTVRGKPAAEVVDQLHEASRGRPAALVAGIAAYRAAGALSIVDRHAYLAPPGGRPALHKWDTLLAPVRGAGEAAWAVARAMSVLAPLGASAPRLIEQVVDLDADEIRSALELLCRRRVLIRAGGGWRFHLPMTADALESGLGPYERRSYSAVAVAELWAGSVHTDDPLYLPNRLVDAGSLVDPKQAGEELLAFGGHALFHDSRNAVRWLQAAAECIGDPDSRAMALLAHAAASLVDERIAEAAENGRMLLERHAAELHPDLLQACALAYLVALAGIGEHAELRRIAEADSPMPGGRAQQLVTKAFALGWLNRWVEGRRLLEDHRDEWIDGPSTLADQANVYRTGVAVMQGETGDLFRFLADPGLWANVESRDLSIEKTRHEVNLLLALGELNAATDLLDRHGLREDQLPYTDQFMVEHSRGNWSRALDNARRSMSTPVHAVRPIGWALLHVGAAQVHTDGGKLSRARQVIESGKLGPFGYLFEHAESKVLRALGEHQAADERLRAGLRAADQSEFAFGTEIMWAELAHRAHRRGDHEQAHEALTRLEKLAGQLGTGRAELALLGARAKLHGDAAAADEAVELARDRGQPYEMATVFSELAKAGFHTSKLLLESYELADGLNALLLRSRLRRAMREHNVSVPSRATTTSENERLLAVLVTEGLTNRQLATVFGATEKSVEGRLTRMFARIGYRSRVELAAAMLTGEYTG
ncbi:AAA family ATPase [Saccharopolyspora gloriosae]|uniref:AAA family ATPase n=1 Tax=Saccharopolyspora gloriosae TaxID=455344 RepID=UPI001FB84A4A|nr:AAA family ATPase [Saccharopolyspora gloriosae]